MQINEYESSVRISILNNAIDEANRIKSEAIKSAIDDLICKIKKDIPDLDYVSVPCVISSDTLRFADFRILGKSSGGSPIILNKDNKNLLCKFDSEKYPSLTKDKLSGIEKSINDLVYAICGKSYSSFTSSYTTTKYLKLEELHQAKIFK